MLTRAWEQLKCVFLNLEKARLYRKPNLDGDIFMHYYSYIESCNVTVLLRSSKKILVCLDLLYVRVFTSVA